MCRLFAAISPDPLNPAFYWRTAPESLLRQSEVDRKRLQGDGWGTAWFNSGRPVVIKSARAVFKDTAQLARAERRSGGNILLGHVRWASNPMKLPKPELIGVRHSQPFADQGWSFVHNGTLLIPREVRAALPAQLAQRIHGNNDSEVLFYWLLHTVINGRGSWPERVRRSLAGIDAIFKRCRASYPLYKYGYHGLNWVLTNGKVLLAFCFVDRRGFDKARALGRPEQSYYDLQLQMTPRLVTIASQPLTPEDNWRSLGHGRLLIANLQRGGLNTVIRKVA
jgi:predicted glutamine amidotransferase